MTKAERTRQLIIEKSAPIFNKKGVAGTAMSDIMEATKLAKGSLYVHFESKEELSYCAVDYNLNTLVSKTSAVINKQKTSKGKLLSMIDFFSDPLNSPVVGGCPMINFGMEADDTNPIILKKVNTVIENMQKNTAAIIDQGIISGEFKKDWDSKKFAIKSFALIEGGILLTRVTGNSDQMKVIASIIKEEIEEKSL